MREAKYLVIDMLREAIRTASLKLMNPIDRIEVSDAHIHIHAGSEHLIFETGVSQTYSNDVGADGPVVGPPLLGGGSGYATLVSNTDLGNADTQLTPEAKPQGFWRRLIK